MLLSSVRRRRRRPDRPLPSFRPLRFRHSTPLPKEQQWMDCPRGSATDPSSADRRAEHDPNFLSSSLTGRQIHLLNHLLHISGIFRPSRKHFSSSLRICTFLAIRSIGVTLFSPGMVVATRSYTPPSRCHSRCGAAHGFYPPLPLLFLNRGRFIGFSAWPDGDSALPLPMF